MLTLDEMRADLYSDLWNQDADPDDHIGWMEHNTQIVDGRDGQLKPTSYSDRHFFDEIINECFAPGMRSVYMKGRQLGASEMFLRRLHEIAIRRGNTQITHTMNDFGQMRIFINQKMPTLYSSPGIRKHVASQAKEEKKRKEAVETRTDKGFINGSIYTLLYLKDEKAAKSQTYRGFRTDALFIDEFADVQESQITPLEEGTSASGLKIIIYNGTPKLQYSQFHDMYLKLSDQRNWYVECPVCKHPQILISFSDWNTWDSHIYRRSDDNGYYFGCERCHAELDRRRGTWKPHEPGRAIRGYYIPQLLAPWVSADEFRLKFESSRGHVKTEFIREILGIPYSGEDAPVREEWLLNCIDRDHTRGQTYGQINCFGMDWGNISHYVIAQVHEGIYYIVDIIELDRETINDQTREVVRVLKDLHPFVACLDFGYGVGQNQEVMSVFPGKVWSVTSGATPTPYAWDTARGEASRKVNWHVSTNHTIMVEDCAGMFERRIWRFPGRTEADVVWSKSKFPIIMNVEKEIKELDTGKRVVYHTTRAHIFCALCYAMVAGQRAGSGTSDRVQTKDHLDDFQDSDRFQVDTRAEQYHKDVWSDEPAGDSDVWK